MRAADPVLGRESERHRALERIRNVAEHGAALCVVGEPGIGKTALLGALAADAVGEGMAVLSATGVRSETHLPFAALHELLDPIVDRIGAPPHRRQQQGGVEVEGRASLRARLR